MIDFIIVNRRWETSVSMCRAFPKADVGSDHQLVMAAVKIKLKRLQKQIPERRFDVDNLKKEATKLEYQNAIKEQAEKLEAELHCDKAESQVEHLWERIKQIYTETATKVLGFKNKVKRAPWISDEILELSDKRQQLKQTKSSNPTSRKEYNKLTKEIKRMSKKCKEEWIEGKCRELQISDAYNNTQQLYRTVHEICDTFTPKLAAIKNKAGQTIDDKVTIKSRWKEYFNELYNVQNPTDTLVLNELETRNEDQTMENFLEEEVREAIQALKTRKAPGVDNITSEMLQAGGESSVKMMHTLCNNIYEEKKCPEDWGRAIIVPIHKKGDKKVCSNYRGISLLSVPGKVYTRMLQQRLKQHIESVISEEQAGFRMGRGTIDQLFVIRQLAEKYCEQNRTMYNNFIDFKQAFDSVWQKGLWQVLRTYGIPEHLIQLLEDLYSKSLSAVRVDSELTEWFRVTVGARQGCNLSPYLFNFLLEAIMQHALAETEAGVTISGEVVNNLRFADDIDLIAETEEQLQELTDRVNTTSARYGLLINKQKTKTMTIEKSGNQQQLKILLGGDALEQVKEFVYLGGLISQDGSCTADVKRRIGLASAVFGKLNRLWKSKNIATSTKVKMYETLVIPVFMYGSECWTLRKEDEHRIEVAEMNWLRRILRITRLHRMRNEDIRNRLQQEVTLIDRIRKKRLSWFGHVTRMNERRLPQRAMHCYVTGRRTRGRQRKRWRENIMEDLETRNISLRQAVDLAGDRVKWRHFVTSSLATS